MILAAPLVIPFAEAVGISIATLGIAKASDMVNEYIQENPEKSAMILKTLVPNLGIGEIFMKKGKDEEVEEEVSVEDIDSKDLTREEKAKMMKELAKSGASREKMIKGYEEIIQPGEDRTLVDAEERYDEGGVEDAPKPKFDYKKFFRNRRADGGAIGIEVLFEEKKPRKNFFMGGPALEGPALGIYNSMKAYQSFTDQEIADAIRQAGYELPTADSGTTPPNNSNQSVTVGGNAEGFSVYNPDPNRTRSFREDPRVAAANEADIRNRTLTEMGIVDPFADEISLSGAYYGDMPEDTSNQIGKQSTSAKIMQGIRGILDNPITSAIGFAMNPAFGAIKGIAKGIGSLIPDQIRPTQENILGNLGIRVNDIGQIISTGDYDDESGDNVMAGYNVSRMTPETFAKRIASIQNRKAAQTDASRRRIAAIEEAKRKFELSQKLAQEQMEARRQASINALNKRKADAKAAGDAEKARKLQIQAAAKAQEISRRQAAQQQAAIERDQGRDRDRGGGANQSGGGYSSGSGYNEGNYCFDPSTLIQMADGSTKEIKNIQLGDDTKGGEVTGVFQFKASDEIHDYKGVTVAGSHYVKEDGKFIMVKDSPLSVKIDKIPVVYSLDTTGRRIFINDIEFADYNGDGVAKNFLTNAGVDLTGFDTEVLRQVENRLI